MYIQNPKQIGSSVIDCVAQKGPCPRNCNQCFYNHDKSLWKPNMPTKMDAKDKIVRMNSLHDSNIKRYMVLKAAKKYKHVFFNTAIPSFDFPEPVVYTANSDEERPVDMRFLRNPNAGKLMFIRLRVSATNMLHIDKAVRIISEYSKIPVVLTFMAYYDKSPGEFHEFFHAGLMLCYTWRVRHVNEYWCPTKVFKKYVLTSMRILAGRQVSLCGTLGSDYCRDCHNCESYFWIAKRRLEEKC